MTRSVFALVCIALATLSCVVHAQEASLCDRYTRGNVSVANNEIAFINGIVTNLLNGAPVNGTDQPMITGLLPSNSRVVDVFLTSSMVSFAANPTTFLADANNVVVLANRLVQFFGTGFGCSAPQFPLLQPSTSNLRIRADFIITKTEMAFFRGQVVDALMRVGVTSTDIATIVDPFLASFHYCAPVPICNDVVTCDLAVTGDATCAVTYFTERINAASQRPTTEVTLASSEYDKILTIQIIASVITVVSVVVLNLLVMWLRSRFCGDGYSSVGK